jgi:hypothetical protein
MANPVYATRATAMAITTNGTASCLAQMHEDCTFPDRDNVECSK